MEPHLFSPPSNCYLPQHFWESRMLLTHIQQAAFSRARCPDSVLVSVVCRVAAITDYRWVLPPVVGGVGSLNMIGGLIARPGGGKSSSAHIAAELVPFTDDVIFRNIGSGEGIAAAHMKEHTKATTDEGDMFHRYAMFYVDEGGVLANLNARQGSTLAETMRTYAHGGQLGQQNGNKTTTRHVPAHGYRGSILVGFQPSNAGPFIQRVAEGTPQRFVWAAANGGGIPEPGTRPQWPGVVHLPMVKAPTSEREMLTVTTTIRNELEWNDHDRNSGTLSVASADSHRDLERLRLSGLLAIMEGRTTITDDDWALADVWSNVSRNLRDFTLEWWNDELQQQRESDATNDGRVSEVRTEAMNNARAERVARRMVSYVMRHGNGQPVYVPPGYLGRDNTHRNDAARVASEKGWLVFTRQTCTLGPNANGVND